ncbi:MAG TPA: hypothetical protein VMB19_05610 [Silvibacterium sp.]|nr:hypothetical protein [Silvibacterium sp.]
MLKQIAAFAAVLASVSVTAAQNVTMVSVGTTLEKTIDAKKAKAGDPINAKVSTAAQLSDGTKVPIGSVLVGHIDSVTPSEKKSDSIMAVTFDKLQIKNGNTIDVKTTLDSAMTTAPASSGGYDQGLARQGAAPNASSDAASNTGGIGAPHPIEGLTVTGSPHDASSGTLTQSKGNVHLSSGVILVFSVAIVPAGAKVQ